jgi:hypothetical protein
MSEQGSTHASVEPSAQPSHKQPCEFDINVNESIEPAAETSDQPGKKAKTNTSSDGSGGPPFVDSFVDSG